MSDYCHKYLKYKAKYNDLKTLRGGANSPNILNISEHKKRYFVNINERITIDRGNKKIKACVVPHAGSAYVKPIMDYVFSGMDTTEFKTVVLLTTNHHDSQNHHLKAERIEPFGLQLKTINSELFVSTGDFFYKEHSYLSILPYLKFIGKPVLVFSIGNYDNGVVEALESILDDNILLVANTDLLHCGENYGIPCPEDIEGYNLDTIGQIIANKTGFRSESMCGLPTVRTFMELVNRRKYSYSEYVYTSSDLLTDDVENSVGYPGIIYNADGVPDLYNNKYLLSQPRKLIEYYFANNIGGSNRSVIEKFRSETKSRLKVYLRKINGIFITIEKDGNLRGCIGTFKLLGDVLDTVLDRTLDTAFKDRRFKPVKGDEIDRFSYKINYLEEPFQIDPTTESIVDNLVVGKHGITIKFENGGRSTYLASVLGESFGITQNNLINKVGELIDSLRDKAGGTGALVEVELYRCTEIAEH